MTLEQQVVSLELAKKLKELGCKQESYFWWDINGELTHFGDGENSDYAVERAYSVAELLNMLQEIRNCEIIIPVVSNVADWLAQEIINEKSPKKD